MLQKLRYDNRGFTLIELMVVIIILGILAMYVAPKIMGRPGEARQVKARLDIQNLESALKLYKLDNGIYPTTEQGLQALVEQPETGVVPKKWKSGGSSKKAKSPKTPGATILFTCLLALKAILTSSPMDWMACPAARRKTRMSITGKSNSFGFLLNSQNIHCKLCLSL
jgi:general secretion pathway protein G